MKKDFPISLKDLEGNNKEIAINRCNHRTFAKNCYWMLLRHSKGYKLFFVRDIADYSKISHGNTYRFLEGLVLLGYAKKNVGVVNTYQLINNSTTPKLKELLPYIIKTLEGKK